MAFKFNFWPGAVAGGLCIPDMVTWPFKPQQSEAALTSTTPCNTSETNLVLLCWLLCPVPYGIIIKSLDENSTRWTAETTRATGSSQNASIAVAGLWVIFQLSTMALQIINVAA